MDKWEQPLPLELRQRTPEALLPSRKEDPDLPWTACDHGPLHSREVCCTRRTLQSYPLGCGRATHGGNVDEICWCWALYWCPWAPSHLILQEQIREHVKPGGKALSFSSVPAVSSLLNSLTLGTLARKKYSVTKSSTLKVRLGAERQESNNWYGLRFGYSATICTLLYTTEFLYKHKTSLCFHLTIYSYPS